MQYKIGMNINILQISIDLFVVFVYEVPALELLTNYGKIN